MSISNDYTQTATSAMNAQIALNQAVVDHNIKMMRQQQAMMGTSPVYTAKEINWNIVKVIPETHSIHPKEEQEFIDLDSL